MERSLEIKSRGELKPVYQRAEPRSCLNVTPINKTNVNRQAHRLTVTNNQEPYRDHMNKTRKRINVSKAWDIHAMTDPPHGTQ